MVRTALVICFMCKVCWHILNSSTLLHGGWLNIKLLQPGLIDCHLSGVCKLLQLLSQHKHFLAPMISMNNYKLLRVQFNKTCNIFIGMLVSGHRVCVCVCGWWGCWKRVWTSAFDSHASDNISSPAGKQFIRPSGVLFNRGLQAETVFGLVCADQHADLEGISNTLSNKDHENNCEPWATD